MPAARKVQGSAAADHATGAIVARGITKRYGSFTALDNVDLTVPAGTVFGLLGPNGAGKTTMIKVLTALVRADAGSAWVSGHDIEREPKLVRAGIGWVAAEVILDDDLTAMENLWLQAKLQNLSDWKDRASDLLKYFELFDRRESRVAQFSTGMRKKLEIALALLHQPRVIFMDEPTIGLDPATRRMLWQLITGINREYGVTILLTSHYIEEADNLCSSIAIIDHGKIVATGTPSELKSRVKADIVEISLNYEQDISAYEGMEGVLEVSRTENGIRLKVVSSESVLPRILSSLRIDGVLKINVDKPSLETVFIDLTGKRLGEDEGKTDMRKFYATLRMARR